MAVEKEHRTGVAITAACAVLLVYVLFPFVLIVPLELGIRSHLLPAKTREVFDPVFAPLQWLYGSCSPYKSLIDSEAEFLRRAGVTL